MAILLGVWDAVMLWGWDMDRKRHGSRDVGDEWVVSSSRNMARLVGGFG